MAKKTLIKAGDRTITVNRYGEGQEIKNRILNDEAHFAMSMIEQWGMVAQNHKDGPIRSARAAVERAFEIAKLTFQHIKDNRMDVQFPFAKVYPDDQENG